MGTSQINLGVIVTFESDRYPQGSHSGKLQLWVSALSVMWGPGQIEMVDLGMFQIQEDCFHKVKKKVIDISDTYGIV